jgi:aldehyde:ferredoxin oxidoreductase
MGLKLDHKGMKKVAANIRDFTQRFNRREGMTKAHDTLPQRFFDEPISGGKVIKREELGKMLQDYYQLRGWNSEGVPPEVTYLQ